MSTLIPSPELEARAVNTIRMLCADAVQAANSGHPGMPMGMAQAAFTLWTRYLRYNPRNPNWHNRDRFVLSAGHGSMLIYSLLHLTGYDLPLEELKNFRQWGSKTPGHPEYGHTPGVETTTGPLGQGLATGVGMALAARWLGERYNREGFPVVAHTIYGIVSDGDLMEGVASEAASIAGHLKLGNLIYLYDDNQITIDGSTDISFTEDWAGRFAAYGWHVQSVDGMDGAAVAAAIEAAQADPRPSIIGCRSVIGYGSPNKAGTSDVHGAPLGEAELAKTKENLGWPAEPRFLIPEDVADFFGQMVGRGQGLESEYNQLFEAYAKDHPELAAELCHVLAGDLPGDWAESLPSFAPGSKVATRNASGKVLNAIAKVLPTLLGGSADLAGSNKTDIDGSGDVLPGDFSGRNLRFGVREHGMGAILNGMALHGGIIPYGGTFLIFSDYMRPSMRLAALMGVQVIYVLTHDSIGLGEDGPTHQPIEQLASLRAIPNMRVIRPAEASETVEAWRMAITHRSGPTVLALTRQNLETFDPKGEGMRSSSGAARGGYILYQNGDAPEVILLATGSEVEIALAGAKQLAGEGRQVRVVSLPCWELFAAQDAGYQAEVLPGDLPKVAIEAAVPFGWERWVGNDPAKSRIIGIPHFGASAPYERIYQEFGLTPEAVASAAREIM